MSRLTAFSTTVVAILLIAALPLPAQTVPPGGKEQVDKMIALLKSDAPLKEKVDACRGLAFVGTKDAVPALAALLGDEKLSHMARYALEPIPDPAVDDALREALGKLKGRLLAGVIGSIGVRRDAKAVEPLAKMFQDSDSDVVQAAARSLGGIGTPEAAKALQDALASASAANLPALCEGLFRSAEAMAAKDQRAEALAVYDRLRALPTAPHQVRTAALRGAILNRGSDGLALLREQLKGKDYLLFAAAVRTSQEMRGPEVAKTMAEGLPALSADRQIVILQALGGRREPMPMPAIADAARVGEKPVRLAAIHAMQAIGHASAASALLGLIGDPDREIAQAAQEALAALPGRQVDEIVIAMLASGEPSRRLLALDFVGRRRMTTAMPALLKAARDPDSGIRTAALKRLGELAGPPHVPALVDLLMRPKEPQDLSAAEEALSAACARAEQPEPYATNLVALMGRAGPAQKSALVRVLGKVGGAAALKAVRAGISDPNAEVRAAAIRTLSAWKTADVVPDLLALAQNAVDPTDKRLALRGCLTWAAGADLPAQERLSMCRKAASLAQSAEEKKALLSALGSIPSTDAIDSIMPYVADAAVKDEACAAVVSVAQRLLKDQDAAKSVPKLIEPLKKVAEVATGEDLPRRAKAALRQAQKRAGGK